MLHPVAPPPAPPADAPPAPKPFSLFDASRLDFGELLNVMWRRKWLLVLPMVAVVGLTVLAVTLIPPRYRANATVMVKPSREQIADLAAVLSGYAADNAAIESEMHVLESRDLARKVVQELDGAFIRAYHQREVGVPRLVTVVRDLDVLPPSWLDAVAGWLRNPEVVDIAELSPEDRAETEIELLQEDLHVSQLGNSRVLKIAFEAEDPQFGALVANTVANRYMVQQLEAEFNTTQRASVWLSERLASLRQEVEQAEGKAEAYRATTAIVEGRNSAVLTQQIAAVTGQLTTAINEMRGLQGQLESANSLLKSGGLRGVSSMMQDEVTVGLRNKLNDLRRREAELRQNYLPRHPSVLVVQQEIERTLNDLESGTRDTLASWRSNLNAAKGRVASLEEALTKLQEQLGQVNQQEVELRALVRDAEASRTLYETLLSRYKETEQNGWQQPHATVVSTAGVPVIPVYPNTMLLLGLAVIFGGCTGVGLTVMKELLARGLNSTEEARQRLGLPCLAAVPQISRYLPFGAPLADYVIRRPDSRYAECLRYLHVNLLALQHRLGRSGSVMVTSAMPAEGKSMLVVSLARVAAAAGRSVVVIDADLRRAQVHQRFQVKRAPGLTDFLDGQATLEDMIQPDPHSTAKVIGAGTLRHRTWSYFQRASFGELIETLKESYDLVLIDVPPISPVADALAMGKHADLCLLAVRWQRTRALVAEQAVARLREADVPLAGAVLTRVVERNARWYTYGSVDVIGRSAKYYYRT